MDSRPLRRPVQHNEVTRVAVHSDWCPDKKRRSGHTEGRPREDAGEGGRPHTQEPAAGEPPVSPGSPRAARRHLRLGCCSEGTALLEGARVDLVTAVQGGRDAPPATRAWSGARELFLQAGGESGGDSRGDRCFESTWAPLLPRTPGPLLSHCVRKCHVGGQGLGPAPPPLHLRAFTGREAGSTLRM